MKLAAYIDKLERDTGAGRMQLYRSLAELAGVSESLVRQAARGLKVRSWNKAKAISEATSGTVSIRELCDEQ